MMMLKKHNYLHISLVAILLLLAQISVSYSQLEQRGDWHTNDINIIKNGMYQRSGGDPYIIFPPLLESVCVISGISFEIRFSSMISKPFLTELFWKAENAGFSEQNKVFFILHPGQGDTLAFTVPIPRAVGYNQIRLDLPRDLDVSFSIEKYEVRDLRMLENTENQVEVYSTLSTSEAKELDTIIPYLIYTLKHGGKRLLADLPFFVFWSLLIILILFSIRFVKRKMSN